MDAPRLGVYPEHAPDELLYSYLARLSLFNALSDPGRVMRWFLDDEHAVASIDLPTRVANLQRNLSALSPMTSADQWIDRATLLPYYGAFLPPLARAHVRSSMLSDSARNLKWRMGLIANGFGATATLRYCPVCLGEDEQAHACAYWHRAHHLPGVTVCIHHAVSLVPFLTPSRSEDKQQLALPPLEAGAHMDKQAGERLLRFARLSNALLHAELPAVPAEVRAKAYREALMAGGYACSARLVDFDRLAADVRQRYAGFKGFPQQDRLLSSHATPLAWLRSLVLMPHRSLHPICHLLFIDFLFGSLTRYREAIGQTATGGLMSTVPPVTKTSPTPPDHLARALLMDTSRSCRSVAAELGLSVHTIVKRRRMLGVVISERRKSLDDDRIDAIADRLRQGMPAKKVAEECSVSLASVYRIKAISPPAPTLSDAALKKLRNKQRCHWSHALRRHPGKGVKAARYLAPTAYAWLYRNDRTWLLQINSQFALTREHHPRVDWLQRDEQLCGRLVSFANEFRSRCPHRRITKSVLARAVGEPLIRRHAEKLPKTVQTIQRLTQSRCAFRGARSNRSVKGL